MKKFLVILVVVGVIGIMTFFLWSSSTTTIEPYLHKDSYNESAAPTDWVGKGDILDANFSGYFDVSVFQGIDNKIRIWVTPREGAKTVYIRVLVKRKFLNELYLEVMPPDKGKVEISSARSPNETIYVIQVYPSGDSGEGTYEMIFIDMAPEKTIKMEITVEIQYGFRKYRGELSAVIVNPFFRPLT